MALVHLHFKKDSWEVSIPIIPDDTPLWKKWFLELKYVVDTFEWRIDELAEHRIYNLDNYENDAQYIKEINRLVLIINESQQIFSEVSGPLSQNLMNELHHQFELFTYLSSQEKESLYSLESQNAFSLLNLVIHKWESRLWIPRIVSQCNNWRVLALDDEDYDCWTTKWKPWAVALNYCLTGKKIVDVWRDNDDIIQDENIRPQHIYSAAFQIFFGEWYFCTQKYEENFNNWWGENISKLSDLWFIKWDKTNTIGEGIVGRLKNPLEWELEKLKGVEKILRVSYEE
jgi:hypothetical protein